MNVSFVNDFAAGWIGGAAGLVVGHPLDTVKTRLQALPYTGLMNCIVSTVQKESVLGLYKGLMFPFLSVGISSSIFFGFYGGTLKYYATLKAPAHSHVIPSPSYREIVLGGLAGAVSCWTIVTQIYRGAFDCCHQIYAQYGLVRGLYRGGACTLWRDVIACAAVYMPAYEFFLRQGVSIHCPQDAKHPFWRPIITIIAGGVAGVLSWIAILPLDVVKSKIQADDWRSPKYKGALDCAIECYKTEGYSVFFRGWTALTARAFPVNAATFLVYSYALDHLNERQIKL